MFDRRLLKWVVVAFLALLVVIVVLFFRGPRIKKEAVDESSAPRPDVIEWIDKHYRHDHRKKTALLRLAESNQHILIHPDADEAERKEDLAMACYGVAFGDDKERIDGMPAYEALAAQSFNTSDRARKYNAYLGSLSGKVFSLTEITLWDEQCEKPLWP